MNTNELYAHDGQHISTIWELMNHFHPRMSFLRSSLVKDAIMRGEKDTFIRITRETFFPGLEDDIVQEQFRLAMNRGISCLNTLSDRFLGEQSSMFHHKEIHVPFSLYEFIAQAREERIQGLQRKKDPELLRSAFDKVQAYGLGYRILQIDESPEVIAALRNYRSQARWLEDHFQFQEALDNVWNSSALIQFFGECPYKSRVKVLQSDGSIHYGSVLIKMMLHRYFPDEIKDHSGVEFIVANNKARDHLIRYFRTTLKTSEKLEGFFDSRYSHNDNPSSSPDLDYTKFLIRLPFPEQAISSHPLGAYLHARHPVEVQIFTKEGDRKRCEVESVNHETYKREQFMRVFPALFPSEIYEPMLR